MNNTKMNYLKKFPGLQKPAKVCFNASPSSATCKHITKKLFHKLATRSLVAVKPRRPPKTNVDTETAFRHDHCKTCVHIQKVNISEVGGQLIRSNSEVRVHTGAKFGHTRCWSIAKCRHPGTSQVDFQVDCPPPASSPPGDLLITMVKEAVILYKKSVSKNEKKLYLSLI